MHPMAKNTMKTKSFQQKNETKASLIYKSHALYLCKSSSLLFSKTDNLVLHKTRKYYC